MLRSLAKTCIACAYSWSGIGRWLGRNNGALMPFIAGYHRVVKDFDDSARHTIPSMLISSRTFEKHLDQIGRHYSFVSLDDIASHLRNDRPFARPMAAITFDDGYADVYHHAFPILKRKGIPAAVFVVTGLVGSKHPQIHDRLYSCLAQSNDSPLAALTQIMMRHPQREVIDRIEAMEAKALHLQERRDEFTSLSWEMIEEMERSHIAFGSHTNSHVLLTSETPNEVDHQLADSKRMLETQLKHRIDHFAYPDGRFNRSILEAVGAAGYRFAYTICGRRDLQFPLFTIPRKILWEEACTNFLGQFSPSVMRCHTDGIFKTVCEHTH